MADTVKHTPGPWSVGYRGMDIVCTNAKIGGHAKLFDIRGWGYLTGNGHGGLGLTEEEAIAVQEANARLVSAAPDLLEALKDCVGRFTEAFPASENYEPIQKARAAISKATGGQ